MTSNLELGFKLLITDLLSGIFTSIIGAIIILVLSQFIAINNILGISIIIVAVLFQIYIKGFFANMLWGFK